MKIVISGYYGHGNFGDEAILSVIKSELEKIFDNPKITAISPPSIRGVVSCDLFISGGGSLLQDVTSLRSLLYYLGILYFAIILKKKTMIYAQGIGPINSSIGKKLTAFVLRKVDLITVRDKESAKLLKSLGISSTVTADPVWTMNYTPKPVEKDKVNIGIQLRDWKALTDKKLKILAEAVSDSDVVINLIALQEKQDTEVLKRFQEKLHNVEVKFIKEDIIDTIANMDYLIAMRYHACLIAAKYGVPFLAITYDPKVKSLAKEVSAPYVAVRDMGPSMLSNALKYLTSEKDQVSVDLKQFADKKAAQASLGSSLLRDFFQPDSKGDHGKS